MLTTAATVFKDQVTTDLFSQNIFYWIASGAVTLAVVGLCFVEIGLVGRRNVLDSVLQKLVGFLIGTFAFAIIGFGIWNWQFNTAFEVPNALGQGIKDWWIGGTNTTSFAQFLDSEAVPGANNSQIFLVFLAVYAGFICVLLHFAGSERLKAGPYYALCAVIGGIAYPVLLWLTWGSTSPLTNNGTHDFIGVFTAYVFTATLGFFLARRLGPRIGLMKPDARGRSWTPYNVGLSALGVLILLFAIPLVALGCGYFVPGEGFFGIAMTTSGFGVVLTNVYMAFCGGAIVGAIIAYRTKNPVHAVLGPLSGYVAVTSGLDVLKPLEVLVVALVAPLVVAAAYEALHRRGIDESKIVPLGASAIFGTIVIGFIAWGTKTGGYFGLEGKYGFQNAEITPWWQLIGLAAAMGMAALVAGFAVILDKTVGLRVSEEAELEGADAALWNLNPVGAELQLTAAVAQPVAPVRPDGPDGGAGGTSIRTATS